MKTQRSVHFISPFDGENASTRYRCISPAEQLRSEGWSVKVSSLYQDPVTSVDAQIVVLHRVWLDDRTREFIQNLKAANKILVYGVDDLVFTKDWAIKESSEYLPNEVSPSREAQQRSMIWNEADRGMLKITSAMLMADCVLCSTQHLADRAANMGFSPYVMRNYIPDEVWERSVAVSRDRSFRNDRVVFGYMSGTPTHNNDFAEISQTVARILQKFPQASLLTVGPVTLPPCLRDLGPRVRRLPIVPWRDLPSVVSSIDANLAPLDLIYSFNHAKSHLKWLEAAAVRIPTIASATNEFRSSILDGINGFLADGPEEWECKMTALLDKSLCKRVGEEAYASVEKSFRSSNQTKTIACLFEEIAQTHAKANGSTTPVVVKRPAVDSTLGRGPVDIVVRNAVRWVGRKFRGLKLTLSE